MEPLLTDHLRDYQALLYWFFMPLLSQYPPLSLFYADY